MLKKIKEIVKKALEAVEARDKETNAQTIGMVRGGSCGALVGEKSYAAKCARLDQARLLGIQKKVTPSERVMFSAGFGHEVYVEGVFKDAGIEYWGPEYFDKNPYRIPIKREGKPDLIWGGRPDFEIMLAGKRVGVEAKSLVSNYSVKKQREADWPYMRHVVQAGAYMVMLEREEWLICIGHYFYASPNFKTKIEPQVRWYSVTLDSEGELQVANERGEIKPIGITLQHIKDYYLDLDEKNSQKKLAKVPTERELDMKPYNRCNYCDMQNSCNKYDTDQMTFEEWMTKLKGEEDE